MSKKKKCFFIVIFVMIDVFLLISYLSIRDYTLLNNLKKEVSAISKLDIGKDRYNRKIKTRGNYAIVEKAIKEYLDENALLLQDTFGVLKEEELKSILSYDNYSKDGPLFTESLKYLKSEKESFNNNLQTFLDNLSEEEMSNYIKEKTNDSYSQKLYRELILNSELRKKYDDTKKLASDTSVRVNHLLDSSHAVLDFLVANNGFWIVENGEIKFANQDLYNQYVILIGQLNN